jgi:hypothetical protein
VAAPRRRQWKGEEVLLLLIGRGEKGEGVRGCCGAGAAVVPLWRLREEKNRREDEKRKEARSELLCGVWLLDLLSCCCVSWLEKRRSRGGSGEKKCSLVQ